MYTYPFAQKLEGVSSSFAAFAFQLLPPKRLLVVKKHLVIQSETLVFEIFAWPASLSK